MVETAELSKWIATMTSLLGIVLIVIGGYIISILNKREQATTNQKRASKGLLTVGIILFIISFNFWIDIYEWNKSMVLARSSLIIGIAIVIFGFLIEEKHVNHDSLSSIVTITGMIVLSPGLSYLMVKHGGSAYVVKILFLLGISLIGLGATVWVGSNDNTTLRNLCAITITIGGFISAVAVAFYLFTKQKELEKIFEFGKKKSLSDRLGLGGLLGRRRSEPQKSARELRREREEQEEREAELEAQRQTKEAERQARRELAEKNIAHRKTEALEAEARRAREGRQPTYAELKAEGKVEEQRQGSPFREEQKIGLWDRLRGRVPRRRYEPQRSERAEEPGQEFPIVREIAPVPARPRERGGRRAPRRKYEPPEEPGQEFPIVREIAPVPAEPQPQAQAQARPRERGSRRAPPATYVGGLPITREQEDEIYAALGG